MSPIVGHESRKAVNRAREGIARASRPGYPFSMIGPHLQTALVTRKPSAHSVEHSELHWIAGRPAATRSDDYGEARSGIQHRVSLSDQFVDEVSAIYHRVAAPEIMPAVLVEACTTVLSVEGAGLSLTSRIRVPLAASSALASRAERLQTTLGEGPCLDATAAAMPLVVDVPAMATAWPMFGQELVAQTPFRSVASIPMRSADRTRFGALDLYSTRPDPGYLRDIINDAVSITDLLGSMLFGAPASFDRTGQRTFAWMTAGSVEKRMNVWIAVGMLLALGQSNEDALALMRAYAFSHNTTLDDVANQIVDQRRPPDDLLPY